MTDINIINRRLEISDELIESLLITAFEGGSTYWADNVSCEDREDMCCDVYTRCKHRRKTCNNKEINN